MMRELLVIGVITLAFGLASLKIQGELALFGTVQLAIAAIALGAAGLSAARNLRQRQRRTLARGSATDALLMVVAVTWGVLLLEGFASHSQVRFDLTFEGRYHLSPATCAAVTALSPAPQFTLYFEPGDPRVRQTRQLLDEVARCAPGIAVREKDLLQHPEDEDRFEIGSSDSVVIETATHWETVQRPGEGTLYEALARLDTRDRGTVYFLAGTGEGDIRRSRDLGYSGLATALETEGYRVGRLTLQSSEGVPTDAAAVIAIAPQRRLRAETLAALRDYLNQGNAGLVAFLEPCRQTGLEELLGEFGIDSPDALVVDPTSGRVEGDAYGVRPLASNYTPHPSTRGLNSNRMTFFGRSRVFKPRKPRPDDTLRTTVFTSNESWLDEQSCTSGALETASRPADVSPSYFPLVVTGDYERGTGTTRIVAFGNADLASNRYLRSVYNLDLVLNSIHWAVSNRQAITIRPKSSNVLQFPLPLQSTLQAFYGVGLLVPELSLIAGGVVWIRRRRA